MLKRWREDYYLSRLFSTAARPVHSVCALTARQIETKIKRNGISFRLPNNQVLRMAKDAGIGLASALFWHGIDGHEPETSRILRFFFERSSNFIDVGANYGFYSLLGALWNPNLQVIAFEPLLPIYEGLTRNVDLNHLGARIRCENLALGSHSGPATLYLPPGGGKDLESTATLSSNSWQVRQHAQPLKVEAVTFDDYESRRPLRVDLVKIDVEDFEADVLRGMERVIRRDRPFIVCEILPRNREHKNERTRQVIESLNYTAYWITSGGFVRVSRFDFERPFTNFLLSPVSVEQEVLPDPLNLWALRQTLVPAGPAGGT
jgi:FkbM family methyltransferase